MGKKQGKKYKEAVPMDFLLYVANEYPVEDLMPVARLICPTDYAVSHFYESNHPKFYHNEEAFRHALRRAISVGAFEHRKNMIDRLNLIHEYEVATSTEAADVILEHQDEIVKRIDNRFETSKDYLAVKIKKWIREALEDSVHYEWQYDGCPYDHSGELTENGSISLDQTVYEFLNDEYTGSWSPTYESGRGKNWSCYGDDLSYLTLEYAENIMDSVITEFVQENDLVVSKYNEWEIRDKYHDTIYDESIAYSFFGWEYPVEFCGLSKMKLSEIL